MDPHLHAQAGRQRRPADHRRLRRRHGQAGGIQTFGLKEGGIDYAQNEYNKELLGDIPTTLDELKQKIADGEIKVPDKPAA